jgi:uncharacterized protein (TIGR02246 family)
MHRRPRRMPGLSACGGMVMVWVAALATAACTTISPANDAMHEDEALIRAELDAFGEAWNRGDAAAAASFFAEDGMRVGAFGDVQYGRAELEAAYEELLHGAMAGATVRQGPATIRMLAPELAVVQGTMEIVTADGGPVMRGYVVQIMRKVEGQWLVLQAHPKLFPPRQGTGADEAT